MKQRLVGAMFAALLVVGLSACSDAKTVFEEPRAAGGLSGYAEPQGLKADMQPVEPTVLRDFAAPQP
ncbi:MAG: hypothetical protein HC822_16695 [Oscillochloris sp.]|nr:hypothetical protein [Oscillochloris sp.]